MLTNEPLTCGQQIFLKVSRGLMDVRRAIQMAMDRGTPSYYLEAGWTPEDFVRASCLMDDMVRLSNQDELEGPEKCLIARRTQNESALLH